jgi:CHAT domain-containing protein
MDKVELRRKAITLEALATQRDAVLGGLYPEVQESLDELRALRTQIAQKTLSGPRAEGLQSHQALLISWEQRREALEASLARRIPEMRLERQLRTSDHKSVASALPTGAALVEFVRFVPYDFRAIHDERESLWKSARYLAFVLIGTNPDEVRMIDLGDANAIDQLVANFRGTVAVAPGNRPSGGSGAGENLRGAVFDKLIPALQGCKLLMIAPDGDLNTIPFESLPDGYGRLLIEDYRISYLSCGRDVLRLKFHSRGEFSTPLVVADPAFNLTVEGIGDTAARPDFDRESKPDVRASRDLDRGFRFWRLKGTREEGERVANLLGVNPLLGSNALESRVKQARSPGVMHLATHGFFLQNQPYNPDERWPEVSTDGVELSSSRSWLASPGMENPLLRSGLALAGVNMWLRGKPIPEEAEDGLLTAEDVTGMDLSQTDLVVLSACETGLGEVRTGEGVFGLRRAFVLAGARSLIMSLWKVPDEQTRELMVDFYDRVLHSIGVAEALREAQLAMRARYAECYYWGAFICQGDPGPIRCRRG